MLVYVPFLLNAVIVVSAKCYNPGPAYPIPVLAKKDRDVTAFTDALDNVFKQSKNFPDLPPDIDIKNSSFSVQLSSAHETLWEWHQTARPSALSKNGTQIVDGDSVYRIASISKLFTTLSILQLSFKGQLNLDDPITKYITELPDKKSYGESETPWSQITLRSLASQLSGILRDSIMSTPVWDVLHSIGEDPTLVGLPFIDHKDIPSCGLFDDPRPCSREEFFEDIISTRPNFDPNFRSTYSNVAFVLLGYVIESVTGNTYESVIQSTIIEELDLRRTSFGKPKDSIGVIPADIGAWGGDLGQLNATAGIYSTAHDLSLFLRKILSSPTLRRLWLHPASFCTSTSTTYGMPWEIFRSPAFLPSQRAVSFFSKSGALERYYSAAVLVPEQDLALTVMVAGQRKLVHWLKEELTARIVPAVERVALARLGAVYAGRFVAEGRALNSSVVLGVEQDGPGLLVERWVSNGTDFVEQYAKLVVDRKPGEKWRMQLIPTGRFRDENRREEVWRSLFTPEVTDHDSVPSAKWDDFCFEDIENMVYAGRAVNEVVFLFGEADGKGKREVQGLELPGLRVRMVKEQGGGVFSGIRRMFGDVFGRTTQQVMEL